METRRRGLTAEDRIALAETLVASWYASPRHNASLLSWIMFHVGCNERDASALIATVAERRRAAEGNEVA